MKNPKIVNAMSYIDDDIIVSSEKRRAKPATPVWVKWMSLAAAFVLIFGGVLVGVGIGAQASVESVVALDVNPSMEIEINKKEKVVRVNALNEDAEKVLEGMELEKVDLKVAVNAIIGSMLTNGYLTVDRNSILISVDSKDETRAAELTAAVSASVDSVLGANNINASVIAQTYASGDDIKKLAEENGISIAKATLIKKIVDSGLKDSNGAVYTYETLAHLNVNELKLLLESKNAEVDGIQSSGTASPDKEYIGGENALAKALEHAGFLKDAVTKIEIELDFEHGRMVYSIEFKTEEFEFEYEIDVITGEIKEFEKERNDDLDDPDDDDDDDDDDWFDRDGRKGKYKWYMSFG